MVKCRYCGVECEYIEIANKVNGMKCKCGSNKIWISTYKDMQGCDDCGVITGTEKPINSGYPLLVDVLAEIEKRCYDTGENFLSVDRDVLSDELSKYFS